MKRWLLPVLSLLSLAAVLGPALPWLGSRFLGLEYVDHYGTQWFYWYTARQIRSGSELGHTDLFFFPWGKDIFKHTGTNVLDAMMAAPFRALLGPVLGYNAFLLALFALTGWAFHRMARDFTEDRLAAGAATLLFTLSPYALFEALEGRPTQAILLFPVLFVRYTLQAARRRGWQAPFIAGVMLALAGYQYWYYAFFGGVVALAHGLWHLARPLPDSGGRWRTLARHALIAAVALAVTLPVGLPLLRAGAAGVPGLLDAARWTLTANPPVTVEGMTVGMHLWQPFRLYSGFYVMDKSGVERFMGDAVLMPWMFLPLVALAAYRPGKQDRGALLAMTGAVVLLAMGPLVLVGDWALPNAPFLWLYRSVGFLQRLWWPARALAYGDVLLGLAALAALAALGGRPRRQAAAAAALTLLWGVELWRGWMLPFPTWDAHVPAGYRCLASGPEGALIELPYSWTQAHLYYQTAHGRPILGGMLENNVVFTPKEVQDLAEDNALVRALLAVTRTGKADLTWTDTDKQELYDLGYRYVVLQRDAFTPRESGSGLLDNALRSRQRTMREQLRHYLGEPVYTDARINIYSPWGEPSPCQRGDVEPDKEPRGKTEDSIDARLVRRPDKQVIHRVFEPAATEPAASPTEP